MKLFGGTMKLLTLDDYKKKNGEEFWASSIGTLQKNWVKLQNQKTF